MIEDDNCVKDCTKESYQPTKDDQGQQWCFACAIFLCEKCNHNSVQETSKYECTTCIRGARMENGRCTTGPDTEDDTSDSNDTGTVYNSFDYQSGIYRTFDSIPRFLL
jgi:hypothetical protein